MIAMAMSCNPKLLIADEPTTALDVTVQNSILQLLEDLKEEFDTSILFITHDLGVVAEIADRVIVMYKGKIVEQGKIKEIFNNPVHPYTKGLLACRPPLDIMVKRLPVIGDFMDGDSINGNSQDSPLIGELMNRYKIPMREIEERRSKLTEAGPVLQVNELCTWFPSKKKWTGKVLKYVKAVDGVSFEVMKGETIGLVGESGCGKTTLGRSILQLIPPQSGQVNYKDAEIVGLDAKSLKSFRKRMQIIFQDPYSSLNPRMTAGQAITEPILVHKIGRE